MKVTEHNITDWKLNQTEINELIRLVKNEMKQYYNNDKATEMWYGIMLGKLIIMKNTEQ